MKSTRVTSSLTAAAAITVAIVGAPVASADVVTTTLGQQADLVDGDVIQSWTVSDLRASTDVIPYSVRGTLWEATASDEAMQGNAIPIVSNFNARAGNGETYRVLFGVATPQGVNPATLTQGQVTKGKVYFDVTGDSPDSVVYRSGGDDRVLWKQPPPSNRQTPPARRSATPVPARRAATPAPAAAPTPVPAVVADDAPLPEGSQGTPLPEDTPAAPVPASSQGTPLPEDAPAAPVPESRHGTPLPDDAPAAPVPAGSQGTPLPENTAAAPVPESRHGTQLPRSAQGTPLPEIAEEALPEGDPVPAGMQESPVPTTTPVPLP